MKTVLLLAIAALALSVASAPAPAGYDKGFTVSSEDGHYLLRLNVEGQARFVYANAARGARGAGGDNEENGFVVRRTRLDLRGHAVEPRLGYRVRLNVDRAAGGVYLEYAYAGYDLGAGWDVKAGQFKPQFLREEAVNAFRQLAVERSYVTDYFTVDFTEGVEATLARADWRVFLAVHDGSYAGASDFGADRTTVALAARIECVPVGDRKRFDDFSGRSTDAAAVALGVAIDYELGEEGAVAQTPDVLKYTADASLEVKGASAFVAFQGQRFEDADTSRSGGLPTALGAADQLALVAQGGVFVAGDRVEAFARHEWIDFDGVYYRNNGATAQSGTGNLAGGELSITTAGVNLYVHDHAAKFTLDVLYAHDPIPVSNSGAGLVASAEDGELALRTQLQWSF